MSQNCKCDHRSLHPIWKNMAIAQSPWTSASRCLGSSPDWSMPRRMNLISAVEIAGGESICRCLIGFRANWRVKNRRPHAPPRDPSRALARRRAFRPGDVRSDLAGHPYQAQSSGDGTGGCTRWRVRSPRSNHALAHFTLFPTADFRMKPSFTIGKLPIHCDRQWVGECGLLARVGAYPSNAATCSRMIPSRPIA